MPVRAPLQGRIMMAVAVAFPSTPWDNGQRQSGSVSFREANDHRIESRAGMNRRGETSSDVGDTAPTVGNQPTHETPWKKNHGVLGPPSSIQGLNREDSMESDGPSAYSPEDEPEKTLPPISLPTTTTTTTATRRKSLPKVHTKTSTEEKRAQVLNTTHKSTIMRASRFGKQQQPSPKERKQENNQQVKRAVGKRQAALKASDAIKKQATGQSSSDGGGSEERSKGAEKVGKKSPEERSTMDIKQQSPGVWDKNLQAVLDAHRGSLGNALTSPEPLNVMHHAARVKSQITPEHVQVTRILKGSTRGKSRLAGVTSHVQKSPEKMQTTIHHTVVTAEDDDLDVLNSFHQAIQKAMESETALSERISQQKVQLLKNEMEQTLERAYASSQMKYSQAAHQSQAESNSAIQSLHSKLEEMSQYFERQQHALMTMKEQCGELQKNAQDILESSQDHINSVHEAEMASLSSLNKTLQDTFALGIQDIQNSMKRSRATQS